MEGKQALVVGGGRVAASKISGLIEGGARVRVVSPSVSRETRELIRKHSIVWEERGFHASDLEETWLVIGATDDAHVQRRVWEEAQKRHLLVCLVDDPAHSNFIAPAVLRRGDLLVTVSTSGKAPALAARLRNYLGEIFGEDFARFLDKLGSVREEFRRRHPEANRRREAWYRWIDSEVIPAIRRGDPPAVPEFERKSVEEERIL